MANKYTSPYTPEERLARKRAYNKAWYAANRDHKDAQNKRWKLNNAERHRNNFRKWSATREGGDWESTSRPETPICEACGVDVGIGGMHGIQWDHDHVTGKFRGWLCPRCNRALGMLDDDLDKVVNLWKYLLRYTDENRESYRDYKRLRASKTYCRATG